MNIDDSSSPSLIYSVFLACKVCVYAVCGCVHFYVCVCVDGIEGRYPSFIFLKKEERNKAYSVMGDLNVFFNGC